MMQITAHVRQVSLHNPSHVNLTFGEIRCPIGALQPNIHEPSRADLKATGF